MERTEKSWHGTFRKADDSTADKRGRGEMIGKGGNKASGNLVLGD